LPYVGVRLSLGGIIVGWQTCSCGKMEYGEPANMANWHMANRLIWQTGIWRNDNSKLAHSKMRSYLSSLSKTTYSVHFLYPIPKMNSGKNQLTFSIFGNNFASEKDFIDLFPSKMNPL